MKNSIKLFVIIAMVTVIGFSLAACGNEIGDNGGGVVGGIVGGGSSGGSIPSDLVGKWTSGTYTIEIRAIGLCIITTSSSENVYDMVVSGNTVILKSGNASVGVFDYSISTTTTGSIPISATGMSITNAGGTIGKTIASNSPFIKLIPPATPTNVSASAASSSSITISWYSVTGAAGYFVYRSSSSSGTYNLAGTAYTNSYTDTGLSASTTYYYRETAVNSSGGESAQSSSTYATTLSSSSPGTDVINLTSGSWYSNTLSAGATHSYRFSANAGSTYYISWEDSDNSSSSYADIKVGLRREGSPSPSYVVEVDDRSSTNQFSYTVPSGSGGNYIIVVQGLSNSYGPYRVRYSTSALSY